MPCILKKLKQPRIQERALYNIDKQSNEIRLNMLSIELVARHRRRAKYFKTHETYFKTVTSAF